MKELKFRAKIPERNATIYFDLAELVHPTRQLFSIRELVIPWLLAGNKPDLCTTLKAKDGTDIYDNDKVKIDNISAPFTFTVCYDEGMWYLKPLSGDERDFLTNYKSEEIKVLSENEKV